MNGPGSAGSEFKLSDRRSAAARPTVTPAVSVGWTGRRRAASSTGDSGLQGLVLRRLLAGVRGGLRLPLATLEIVRPRTDGEPQSPRGPGLRLAGLDRFVRSAETLPAAMVCV